MSNKQNKYNRGTSNRELPVADTGTLGIDSIIRSLTVMKRGTFPFGRL